MNTKLIYRLSGVVFATFLIAACGGGNGTGSGELSLAITDGPVDEASKVVVSFSGVSLKPANGPASDVLFTDVNGDPVIKTIDLLNLQGPNSEPLLIDQTLAAGHYNWLRLKIIASESTTDSYIMINGGTFPLYVPSGDETGLKLNEGFDISDGGAATFTIDFDLRKSVLGPNNNNTAYKLKPTLRIVENDNVGHITGLVGDTARGHEDCTSTSYAVYAFSGSGVTADDIDGIDPNPVSTALVSSDTFSYALGFLDEGVYTLAFTCQSADDNAEADDAINFIGSQDVTVTAGFTSIHNFD
jgi:hypothetical protein